MELVTYIENKHVVSIHKVGLNVEVKVKEPWCGEDTLLFTLKPGDNDRVIIVLPHESKLLITREAPPIEERIQTVVPNVSHPGASDDIPF